MATREEDEDQQQIIIPATLPLLAVRDVVVFPNMVLPLFVGRETSVLAIEAALAQDRLLFLATQKDQAVENPEPADIFSVGTVSLIFQTVGATTHKLAMKGPGDGIVLLGPLGNPTHIEKFGWAVCVGGGIGLAPLHPIVQALNSVCNVVPPSPCAGRELRAIEFTASWAA